MNKKRKTGQHSMEAESVQYSNSYIKICQSNRIFINFRQAMVLDIFEEKNKSTLIPVETWRDFNCKH